jgi:CTP:molybdopterin cytidylyltransferase MocA
MTVAAVVLAASTESALADADGMPSVRRIVDVAWSGGAVPIIVVAADPDGAVAAALAGAPVTLAEPAPAEGGPVGQMLRGIGVAMERVAETDAALLWPARMTWVGPETVTSLLERHGVEGEALLAPMYGDERGWPVLVPVSGIAALAAAAPDLMPDDVVSGALAAGLAEIRVDLGDPGVTHDRSVDRAAMPAYTGPLEPAGGHTHEWGAQVADLPDDGPLDGPALAPYGQAVAADPEQPG